VTKANVRIERTLFLTDRDDLKYEVWLCGQWADIFLVTRLLSESPAIKSIRIEYAGPADPRYSLPGDDSNDSSLAPS